MIALECRADDEATISLLQAVDDASTRAAATGERGVLAALGTGCTLAVGAYGRIDGDLLTVRAFLGGDREGTEPLFGDAAGNPTDAEAVGRGLGEQLKAAYETRYGALT